LKRLVQAKKFYATLTHKLDAAQEAWLETQPEPETTVEFTEELNGETLLGGEMRLTFKPTDNTTS
jgi:hypothetical protein